MALSVGGVIIQQIALDSEPPIGQAVSTAQVSFCLNRQPSVDAAACNATAVQDVSYACLLNLTDPDNGTVTVTATAFSGDPILNVTPNGSINFTPTNDDVGNHTITISAQDDSGCVNALANTSFTLDVQNVNDPPELTTTLPDVSFETNTTIFPFFLVDYFTDPDGDTMNFTSTQPSGIIVTIESSSLVSFTSAACIDGELITFTATDQYNANGTSNVVTIIVTCPSSGGTGDDDDDDDGGGGGGGGCSPNWECDEWFACLPAGEQWQRCYDTKGCASDRYITRQCEYEGPPLACVENWLCGAWTSCAINGTQSRSCEDLAGCGTTALQPSLSQECVYLPTCFDGVQNGDETGVDCGGSCGVCVVTERPSIVERTWWWLVFLLLALLSGGMLVGYYRTDIARAAAALGFLLRHRVTKDILLDAAERKALFERLRSFEARGGGPAERYDALAELVRSYLADALALPLEASADEVRVRARALGLRHDTILLIEGLLGKLAVIEGEELEDDPLFFQASVEELRTAACLTSAYGLAEIDRPLEEYPITDGMSFYDEIFARMIAILRAVQYGQYETARTEYLALLSRYDPLSSEEQEQIYPELRWLFGVTRLASEAVGGRVVEKGRFEA